MSLCLYTWTNCLQLTCTLRHPKENENASIAEQEDYDSSPGCVPSLQLEQVNTLRLRFRSSTQTMFFFGRPIYLLANGGQTHSGEYCSHCFLSQGSMNDPIVCALIKACMALRQKSLKTTAVGHCFSWKMTNLVIDQAVGNFTVFF